MVKRNFEPDLRGLVGRDGIEEKLREFKSTSSEYNSGSDVIDYNNEPGIVKPKLSNYLNLAFVLERKGDWDGTIGIYKEIIKTYSKELHAYLRLGLAFEKKGDFEEAKKYFKRFDELADK